SLRQQLTGAAAAAVELAEYFVGDSGIGGRGPVQANAVGSGGAHCEAGNGCRFLAQVRLQHEQAARDVADQHVATVEERIRTPGAVEAHFIGIVIGGVGVEVRDLGQAALFDRRQVDDAQAAGVVRKERVLIADVQVVVDRLHRSGVGK